MVQSFTTLIKLQKSKVDEQRLYLTGLQTKLEDIDHAVARLEIEIAKEGALADQDGGIRQTLGAYLKVAHERSQRLQSERSVTNQAIEDAREQLILLFEEQKRYELAEAAQIAAASHREKKELTKELDEVGSVQFIRRRNE